MWRTEGLRLCLFALGCLLIAITPLIAILPGPGGIFSFGAGLALVLKNSPWARRRYVGFKRRWPRWGAWTDWGMRRGSARRRQQIRDARPREEWPLRRMGHD